ncbi:PilZ domain-containing protein [Sphingobium sp.]|uniref:PilZ domain-containing protein n=1 Tax=Sphingobium sp. TaxID=1912891 RepID=UPI003BB52306
MSIRALLYSSSNRGAERVTLDRASTLRGEDDTPFDVQIEDISISGFRLRLPFAAMVDQEITIGVPGLGVRTANIVRTEGHIAGCIFVRPLDPSELAKALRFDPSVVTAPFGDRSGEEFVEAGGTGLSRRRKLAFLIVVTAGAWTLVGATVAIVNGLIALLN